MLDKSDYIHFSFLHLFDFAPTQSHVWLQIAMFNHKTFFAIDFAFFLFCFVSLLLDITGQIIYFSVQNA